VSVANEAIAGHGPHGAIHHGEYGNAPGATHGSRKSYVVGFLLAIALTIVPFGLVMTHASVGTPLLIAVFALAQIMVHIVYFLHVNRSAEQRWSLMALVFTAIVVGIIIGGSLWIMHNLYFNMMPGMMPRSMG